MVYFFYTCRRCNNPYTRSYPSPGTHANRPDSASVEAPTVEDTHPVKAARAQIQSINFNQSSFLHIPVAVMIFSIAASINTLSSPCGTLSKVILYARDTRPCAQAIERGTYIRTKRPRRKEATERVRVRRSTGNFYILHPTQAGHDSHCVRRIDLGIFNANHDRTPP